MFRTLVTKEILANLRDYRFVLAYFVCSILLVGTAAVQYADFLTQKRDAEVARNIYERRLSDIGENSLGFNRFVVRTPTITQFFCLGGEKSPDGTGHISNEWSPYFHGDLRRNPMVDFLPTVDMVFAIGIVMSLLVFMLAHDILSGEREQGTLAVLLSCPVPRDLVLAAKWCGGFVSLAIPYAISCVVTALVLALGTQATATGGEWVRVFMLFATGGLYLAVVFSMCMMVSVLFRRSTTSVLFLLLVWVGLIVALPSLSTPLAYLVQKPPGVHTTENACLYATTLSWDDWDRQTLRGYLEQLGKDTSEELTEEEQQGLGQYRDGKWGDKVLRDVDSMATEYAMLSRAEKGVSELAEWIRRFSPYGCLQNACLSLAGTGLSREVRFREAIHRYTRRMTEDRDAAAASFRVLPERIGLVMRRSLLDLGLLALMGVLFCLVAYASFVRREVV